MKNLIKKFMKKNKLKYNDEFYIYYRDLKGFSRFERTFSFAFSRIESDSVWTGYAVLLSHFKTGLSPDNDILIKLINGKFHHIKLKSVNKRKRVVKKCCN